MRTRAVSASIICLSLVVAACGGDDDDSADASEAPAATTAPATDTTAPDATGAPDESVAPTSPATSEAPATDDDATGVVVGDDGRLVPTECVGHNVASEADGVTETSANIAALSIDFKSLYDIGYSNTERAPATVFAAMAEAVNAAGGVCGRTLDVQVITYDVLQGQAGQACVEATEDRTNVFLIASSYDQPQCITDTGLPANVATEITAADLAAANGLLFSRNPLLEQQYAATIQHAQQDGALAGKVGVWYGHLFPGVGNTVESVVLPALDEAGVEYVSFRTEGNDRAAVTSAATHFVSEGVETLLMFVGPSDVTGIQTEINAQGASPRYLSAPVSGNSSNELFAEKFGTASFTSGQQYITYNWNPTEVRPDDPIGPSCTAWWAELTDEVLEPGTFDYQVITSMCVQLDELVAAMSIAGGDVTRASMVAAYEQLPPHEAGNLLGELAWSPDHHAGPNVFSVQTFDGETLTSTTSTDFFEVD